MVRSVAVHVRRWDMGQDFEMLTLLCKIKDASCPEVIYFQTFLERIIEVDRSCTVKDDVNVIDDKLPFNCRNTKIFDGKITLNWCDFWHHELPIALFSISRSDMFKTRWCQNLFIDSIHRIYFSLWSDHYVNLTYVWTSSEQLLEDDFSQKACYTCYEDFLSTVKFFNFVSILWHYFNLI